MRCERREWRNQVITLVGHTRHIREFTQMPITVNVTGDAVPELAVTV
jgi:hypothetical protein